MNAIATKAMRVLLRTLEDGVQPPVAAQPSERPFNHPADASGNELSAAAARDGLDRDAECLTRLGQAFAPVAEITKRWALEAAIGEFTQNRDDGFRVMAVRRRDIDRRREDADISRQRSGSSTPRTCVVQKVPFPGSTGVSRTL